MYIRVNIHKTEIESEVLKTLERVSGWCKLICIGMDKDS